MSTNQDQRESGPKPFEDFTTSANVSTDSLTLIQMAPQSAEDIAHIREKVLKDRAIKRMERREQNHKLAEEKCKAADTLLESGNYAGASGVYIEATNLWPSNSDFYLRLTRAYLKCDLYADAAHAATRALSFEPTSLEARYERGIARLEQGLLPAAKIDFETVIAHNSSHTLARAGLERLKLLQATKIGTHTLSPLPVDTNVDGEPVDFSFPHYDDKMLELAERSDSSDCNHTGNGIPCRFYNHDGCARGSHCQYSHAPDEKSVRDDLGKNVCLYHLLSSCKFGDLKCVYSHSKEALPTTFGWWNDAEQIKHVKVILELAETKAKEQRALEWTLYKLESKKTKAKGRNNITKSKGRKDRTKIKEGKITKEVTENQNVRNGTANGEVEKDETLEEKKNEIETVAEKHDGKINEEPKSDDSPKTISK